VSEYSLCGAIKQYSGIETYFMYSSNPMICPSICIRASSYNQSRTLVCFYVVKNTRVRRESYIGHLLASILGRSRIGRLLAKRHRLT
jgi:hypothetical protein